MAGAGVTFEVEGVEEVAAMFIDAGDRADDMRPPLQSSATMMLKAFDLNFDSHGREFNEPWKRRQRDPGHPLLEDTGEMKAGFDKRFGSDFVVLFNLKEYFKYHQSKKPRTTRLPRRVMMKIDEIRRRAIIKYFHEYIKEGKVS